MFCSESVATNCCTLFAACDPGPDQSVGQLLTILLATISFHLSLSLKIVVFQGSSTLDLLHKMLTEKIQNNMKKKQLSFSITQNGKLLA